MKMPSKGCKPIVGTGKFGFQRPGALKVTSLLTLVQKKGEGQRAINLVAGGRPSGGGEKQERILGP